MQRFLFIFSITFYLSSYAQCEEFTAASQYLCDRDTTRAIIYLEKYLQKYPTIEIAEEVNYEIGRLLMLTGDSTKAEEIFIKIIKGSPLKNAKEYKRCSVPMKGKNWCSDIVYPERYKDLQFLSCMNMMSIELSRNHPGKALTYLENADKKYRMYSDCGNGNAQISIYLATSYGQVFKALNNPKKALKKMLPFCIENYLASIHECRNLLIEILAQHYSKEELKKEAEKALQSIRIKKGKHRNQFTFTFMGESAIIPYMDYEDNDISIEAFRDKMKNNPFFKTLLTLN